MPAQPLHKRAQAHLLVKNGTGRARAHEQALAVVHPQVPHADLVILHESTTPYKSLAMPLQTAGCCMQLQQMC